jgi:hypothetical protein
MALAIAGGGNAVLLRDGEVVDNADGFLKSADVAVAHLEAPLCANYEEFLQMFNGNKRMAIEVRQGTRTVDFIVFNRQDRCPVEAADLQTVLFDGRKRFSLLPGGLIVDSITAAYSGGLDHKARLAILRPGRDY